jgi:DNA-binding PadR family transcriptional regulator
VPLTPAVFYILFSLADGEKHGYAIMQNVSKISAGQFRMGPATLYTTIQRLLDSQLIEETESRTRDFDDDSRRRYYKLTREGKAALVSEVSRMESVVRLARDMKLALRVSE